MSYKSSPASRYMSFSKRRGIKLPTLNLRGLKEETPQAQLFKLQEQPITSMIVVDPCPDCPYQKSNGFCGVCASRNPGNYFMLC
jgi:hypothetical protein